VIIVFVPQLLLIGFDCSESGVRAPAHTLGWARSVEDIKTVIIKLNNNNNKLLTSSPLNSAVQAF